MKDEIRAWWTASLLKQGASAHPVFGERIDVDVDDDVVTLRGEVKTVEEVEGIEWEARAIPTIRTVINHLTVTAADEQYHLQTIVATFPSLEAAQLAAQTVADAGFHKGRQPNLLRSRAEAEPYLRTRAQAARIDVQGIERYLKELDKGKVLLVDRVPEDDALHVISALEGSPAAIHTLPPEPGSFEMA